MDSAILPATAALAGSLVGGISTLTASWLSQRGQFRAQTLVQEAVHRRELYAEFIIEAARRLTDAWGHQAEDPEVFAALYSAIQRMRLTSSEDVIRAAEHVVRLVIEAYAAPVRTFSEFQKFAVKLSSDAREFAESDTDHDPLIAFSKACRVELRALRR